MTSGSSALILLVVWPIIRKQHKDNCSRLLPATIILMLFSEE